MSFRDGNFTLFAILSGGDWADASVEHLLIPDGTNLDQERANREVWYQEEYLPKLRDWHSKHQERNPDDSYVNPPPNYFTFSDWLLKRGAKIADVDEFHED